MTQGNSKNSGKTSHSSARKVQRSSATSSGTHPSREPDDTELDIGKASTNSAGGDNTRSTHYGSGNSSAWDTAYGGGSSLTGKN
jgi:hypothetical protein